MAAVGLEAVGTLELEWLDAVDAYIGGRVGTGAGIGAAALLTEDGDGVGALRLCGNMCRGLLPRLLAVNGSLAFRLL